MSHPVLTAAQRRATLLQRQHLLERTRQDPLAVIERIGGLQTQAAPSGYIGLWSRVAGFERAWLTRALEERRVIQGTLIRSTIHTVSAADYWPMTAAVRRIRRGWVERVWRRQLADADTAALARATREELAGGPVRMQQLLARLVERGFPEPVARWTGHYVDLVRVPPSGTWERRRADLYGLADAWSPPPAPPPSEPDGLALLAKRGLGAFGPLAPSDLAGWMGVPVRALAGPLAVIQPRRYRDERGRELVDLPDAAPAVGTPRPRVRLLAVWDPIMLVHFRAMEVLPEVFRPLLFDTRTPQSANAILVDGQVAGRWREAGGRVEVTPFRPLSTAERRAVDAEAEALAAFHRD